MMAILAALRPVSIFVLVAGMAVTAFGDTYAEFRVRSFTAAEQADESICGGDAGCQSRGSRAVPFAMAAIVHAGQRGRGHDNSRLFRGASRFHRDAAFRRRIFQSRQLF